VQTFRRALRPHGRRRDYQLVARPIKNIDRRPLCINTMRTGLSWVNIRFLD